LGLTHLLGNKGDMKLIAEFDDKVQIGSLNVNIISTDKFGKELNENEHRIENPQDILGKEIFFTIEINYGEIPKDLSYNVYCEYEFKTDEDKLKTFTSRIVYLHFPNNHL